MKPIKQQLQELLERWLKGSVIDENIEALRNAIIALETQNRKEWLEQKRQLRPMNDGYQTANQGYQQAINELLEEYKQ